MNLVGKIFVVLIFVMSLVFMTAAMLVYAMHRNWREEVLNPQTGLNRKYVDLQAHNKELTDQLDKLKQQVAAEKNAQRQATGQGGERAGRAAAGAQDERGLAGRVGEGQTRRRGRHERHPEERHRLPPATR